MKKQIVDWTNSVEDFLRQEVSKNRYYSIEELKTQGWFSVREYRDLSKLSDTCVLKKLSKRRDLEKKRFRIFGRHNPETFFRPIDFSL